MVFMSYLIFIFDKGEKMKDDIEDMEGMKKLLEEKQKEISELLELFISEFPTKEGYVWGFAIDNSLHQFYIGNGEE